jgi:hypothetical protein
MVAALAVLLALAVPAASAQTPELRAAEGDWVGYISFRGTTAQTDQTPRGGFEFTSAGAEVEGTFHWGAGVTQIGGVVSGPDTMPRFDLTTVVSNGVDIPDVTGGGEILFTAASCERLEGTGVNIDVEMMGAAEISEIVWWAVRGEAASDPAAFFEAFEALQVKVGDLLKSLEGGAVIAGGGIGGQIEPLLAEAETLAAQLSRAEGCGLEFYRSVIAAEVQRLVDYILANPDVDVFTLGQVLLAAVRAGVIGSGSAADSAGLEGAAQSLLADRIAAAADAEDVVELEVLSWMAEDLGWEDLAYDAIVALVRIGS